MTAVTTTGTSVGANSGTSTGTKDSTSNTGPTAPSPVQHDEAVSLTSDTIFNTGKLNARTQDTQLTDAQLTDAKLANAKSAATRSSDAQPSAAAATSNTATQTLASTSDSPSQPAPLAADLFAVDPSTPTPTFNWRMATSDFAATAADQNAKQTSPSATGSNSPVTPPATVDSTLLPATVKTSVTASVKDAAPATKPTEPAATFVAGPSKTPATDPKAQPDNGTNSLRDVAHAHSETADDNARTTTEKSAADQSAIPFDLATSMPAPAVSTPQIVDPSPVQTTAAKSSPAQSQASAISATPETSGTAANPKTVEAASGAKAQPRKDDSTSSTNSQAADPANAAAPAKASDASASFSVASQPASTGDSKTATANSPAKAPDQSNDQPTGHHDAESASVAPGQTMADAQAAYPTSAVNSARLVERMGESELRLGIRAGEFGSVDIRTSMVRNQFTAEISVERGELGRVMAAELPGLQNRLSEQRVPFANITLQNHTGSQSSASEQQRPRDGQPLYAATNSTSSQNEGPMPAVVALEGTTPASRLDIHM